MRQEHLAQLLLKLAGSGGGSWAGHSLGKVLIKVLSAFSSIQVLPFENCQHFPSTPMAKPKPVIHNDPDTGYSQEEGPK